MIRSLFSHLPSSTTLTLIRSVGSAAQPLVERTEHVDQHIEESIKSGDLTIPIRKEVKPSFNVASFANDSKVIKELTKLGMVVYTLDEKKPLLKNLLKMHWTKDFEPRIKFLVDSGVEADNLGWFLTKNPFIFEVPLDDLEVRVEYLRLKKFTNEAIATILNRAPFWLQFSTLRIDHRLGFFQTTYNLSGDEVRYLATRLPKLILHNLNRLTVCNMSLKEEMGFSREEMKTILLEAPKTYLMPSGLIFKRFDFVHNTMKIPHNLIVTMPHVLNTRRFKMEERHGFLEHLGLAQYDPKKPGYISLNDIGTVNDETFAVQVAKSTLEKFNEFRKKPIVRIEKPIIKKSA